MKKVILLVLVFTFSISLMGCSEAEEEKITELESQISTMNEKITSSNESINTLQETIDTLQSTINDLEFELEETNSALDTFIDEYTLETDYVDTGLKLDGYPVLIKHMDKCPPPGALIQIGFLLSGTMKYNGYLITHTDRCYFEVDDVMIEGTPYVYFDGNPIWIVAFVEYYIYDSDDDDILEFVGLVYEEITE